MVPNNNNNNKYSDGVVKTAASAHLQEVIPTFDMAVNELFFERFPDSVLEHQIQVRPYNALKTRNMRSLNPEGENTHAHTPTYPLPPNTKTVPRETRMPP